MSPREKATKEIIKWVEKILPGGGNKEIYEQQLGKLTDKQFEEYMAKLRSGEEVLFIIQPNLRKDVSLDIRRNLAVAKELNYSFFQRLWLTDPGTGETYLTPIPYMVVDLPLRKQAQSLEKKVSIPQDNSTVDELTGQPTNSSKGGSVSFPELQVMNAQGLDKTVEELIKFRGGDEVAFRAMNKQIIETGSVYIDNIETNTKTKSTEVLSTLLKSMHLDNNL